MGKKRVLPTTVRVNGPRDGKGRETRKTDRRWLLFLQILKISIFRDLHPSEMWFYRFFKRDLTIY